MAASRPSSDATCDALFATLCALFLAAAATTVALRPYRRWPDTALQSTKLLLMGLLTSTRQWPRSAATAPAIVTILLASVLITGAVFRVVSQVVEAQIVTEENPLLNLPIDTTGTSSLVEMVAPLALPVSVAPELLYEDFGHAVLQSNDNGCDIEEGERSRNGECLKSVRSGESRDTVGLDCADQSASTELDNDLQLLLMVIGESTKPRPARTLP
jgi:hypothetical protein